METNILRVLSYNLTAATPVLFLQRLASDMEMDEESHSLSLYLAEISTQELSYTTYTPSQIALSSAILALHTKEKLVVPIISHLVAEWGLGPSQIQSCVLELHRTHARFQSASRGLQASYIKFSTPRFQSVSLLQPSPFPPYIEV